MSTNDKAIHDIIMCIIGEALLEADASFMFGHDFSNIVNKYGPIIQHKQPTVEVIREDINEIKQILEDINQDTPFLGSTYKLVQEKLDHLEYSICDSPWINLD